MHGTTDFDKTLQTTDRWLKEIMDATGLDRRRAYRVLAVLDRHISRGEIKNVEGMLPAQLRKLWP